MLNERQKKQNSIELKENYHILGFPAERICADLGINEKQLQITLDVGPRENATTVWMLRDYMEEKIKEQGKTPCPYTILTHNIYFPYKKRW